MDIKVSTTQVRKLLVLMSVLLQAMGRYGKPFIDSIITFLKFKSSVYIYTIYTYTTKTQS